MKKSIIAVAVVAGVGILWTGSAWYIGKQAEARLDEVIARVNQKLNKTYPNFGLVVSREGFQRHLFSSETRLVLKSIPPVKRAKYAGDDEYEVYHDSPLIPDEGIIFNETISHGPFPLAQIKRGNFFPALLSIHTELAKTPLVEPLFESAKGKIPFTAETRLGFNQDTLSDIQISPLKYEDDTDSAMIDGANIVVATNPKNDALSFKVSTNEIDIEGPLLLPHNVRVGVKGLELESDSQLGPHGLRLGSDSIKLSSLLLGLGPQQALQVSDVEGKSNLTNIVGKINGNLNYRIGDVTWDKASLGSINLKASMRGADAQSIRSFADKYEKLEQERRKAIGDYPSHHTELLDKQNLITITALENLPMLLKGSPQIAIDELSVKNKAGESRYSLNVQFNDPNTSNADVDKTNQSKGHFGSLADRFVKQVTSKLTLNKPMMKELFVSIHPYRVDNIDKAESDAQQLIENISTLGGSYQITVNNENSIDSDFHYSKGVIELNNEKYDFDKFILNYIN